MIGIITKYISATNTQGSRIKASIPMGKSVYIPYDYGMETEELHFKAALHCLKVNGITQVDTDNMRYGGIDNGYCFCFASSIINKTTIKQRG